MIHLSREETFLLLTCRPRLDDAGDERLVRLTRQDMDWAYVLWRAETYQTIPLCRFHLDRLGAWRNIPDWVPGYMAGWSKLSELRSIVQFRLLAQILNTFQTAGIDYYIFKGALVAATLFPDPVSRPMQDLDIMVRPKDLWRVQKALYGLGFKHGVFDPANGTFTHMFRRITKNTLAHKYALHSVTKVETVRPDFDASLLPRAWRQRQIKSFVQGDGTVSMPVFVDIHFGLADGVEEEDVWRGAGPETVLGQAVRCQGPTTALWFSAARAYFEAFQHGTVKPYMLGDIDALVRHHQEAIDWAELLLVARKYGFASALFYVFEQQRRLFETPVPDHVIALLMPNQKSIPDPGDYGDLIPKLLSRVVVNDFALA
ncbi:nucleotidyltransferase family protein [Nitratireductor arenosus]|nr:nucleotidyltransferase family protein [Nitratireductor arenosus]